MKQCDRSLSPFVTSLSSSFVASESDSEDSLWNDFTFDFSFLTSEDHKICPNDATTVPKAKESGHSVFGVTSITPVARSADIANDNSGFDGVEGRFSCGKDESACSGKFLVRKDSNCSPVFSKVSAPRIECTNGSGIDKKNLCSANRSVLSEKSSIQDDIVGDSSCWRRTRSHNTVALGVKSLNFRRFSDDQNCLNGLNPLAPQYIPSNGKKNLDKNGRVFEENCSFSEAGIEQGSNQNTRRSVLIHHVDESLGLVSQESLSNTMSVLDIDKEFQKSTKLDPLAPVFVPACAKLSAFVREKHGAADHMITMETNVGSTSGLSSSDNMLLSNVKVETHSSEVHGSLKNRYSNNAHEWGTTFSFNPQLRFQVQISENTKLDRSSNKSRGRKKLNPLAPQFSLADNKQKVYGCEKKQAANDLPAMGNGSVLISPIGSSSSDVRALSDFGDRHRCSTSSPSPKVDVKKLLTTIHGLSELLTHVHSSETSDLPNEQYLDLINCTVQNLNSYINNRVQEHTGNHSSAVHSSCDLYSLPYIRKQSIRDHQPPKAKITSASVNVKRKEKYSMVSGDMVPDSHFQFGVNKENGFGKAIGNHHQTEEQINLGVF
ncbi:hypothetical protein ARALYDRAFT_911351 [Arabidopsis lyrata subsp. lyrata]|uniref:Uncharacterized protein n=1 Tax=Arabidopsis lyrata subsp. lyrata TaxID=81972 RepID=D7LYP2_ARALL|nr:uncharacterized protein LOC9308586 isoform X1 [Arabidopsis lyrata subsp. lyrata]EFH48776.1 hypothetical protein ARALYDRAFT_911351 [Arabidopsis lyrata subsp. lyrata]|eukprot:XP_002872517.1 uncharacterized protein LOC9308586 isoform X1 [Arabidopsis lyrata subsp. lyrata]